MKRNRRKIISTIILVFFFFIPLIGGIFLSREFRFTTGEDVIMSFVIAPIEIILILTLFALWKERDVYEWGDESDYQKSNHYQNY